MTIPPPAHSQSVEIVLSQVGVKEPLSRTIFSNSTSWSQGSIDAVGPTGDQSGKRPPENCQGHFVSGTLLCNIFLCLAHCCEIFLVGQLNTLYLAQAGILTWTWRWTRCIWGGWWWRRGNPTRAPSCQPQAPPWCGHGSSRWFGRNLCSVLYLYFAIYGQWPLVTGQESGYLI